MANKELLDAINKKKQELEKEKITTSTKKPKIEEEKLLSNDKLVKSESEFHHILSTYINKLDSLRNSLPIVMESIGDEYKTVKKKYDSFIDEKLEKIDKTTEDEVQQYSVPIKYIKEYDRQKQKIDHIFIAFDLLPKNFLVSYVSQYDSFLGEIIKSLLLSHP
ncbi:MAG: hypothetical protein P794_04960 [Epsilonproteobacteria bacterium (ex Lamellibrachia satsuma)]|nr:MAG: hypothetical protein P794_04960 [Epsilonproteobacteria bacterium (ex Lamellibrachia satsuma)]